LDVHRDRFTFEATDLSSYQLGAANLQSIKSQTPQLMQGVSRALEILIEHEDRLIAMQKEIAELKSQLSLHSRPDTVTTRTPSRNGKFVSSVQYDKTETSVNQSQSLNSETIPLESSTKTSMSITAQSSTGTATGLTKKRIAPTPISKLSSR
jgi:hypothetical protein